MRGGVVDDGDKWTDWVPQGKAHRQGRNQMSFVRPLPIYGIWCKVFEEAIKFIFCSKVTTAESPDLANQIEQFFFFFTRQGILDGWQKSRFNEISFLE